MGEGGTLCVCTSKGSKVGKKAKKGNDVLASDQLRNYVENPPTLLVCVCL